MEIRKTDEDNRRIAHVRLIGDDIRISLADMLIPEEGNEAHEIIAAAKLYSDTFITEVEEQIREAITELRAIKAKLVADGWKWDEPSNEFRLYQTDDGYDEFVEADEADWEWLAGELC